MQTKAKGTDTVCHDRELNEELVGVLTAISVVSKRLAGRLSRMEQDVFRTEGGRKPYGKSQRIVHNCGRN